MKNTERKEYGAARIIEPDICENVRDDRVCRIYEEELDCLLERPDRAQKQAFARDSVEGIVHEFKNVLTTITGYAEMSIFEMGDGPTVDYYMKQILGAVIRASNLASRLIDVCRERAKNEPVITSDPPAESSEASTRGPRGGGEVFVQRSTAPGKTVGLKKN